MFLQKINLINFKNYEQSEMIFSEKINCFIGDNGVGKNKHPRCYLLPFILQKLF